MSDVQMNFNHFSLSDVGKVRTANEDSYGDRMTANGYVFTVCDGMGGHVGGATASKIAVESILNFFENPVQNVYVGINDALRFANTQVYNATLENPELKGMGTTATILLINSTDCYIGHVGDSRIYLKSEGKLNRITKDHSFVQQLVDQGLIADEDAENHPKKNQILQAIGIKPNVEPTISETPIQPQKGDCFLLCSDGLNGMISDREIEPLVDENNLAESCQNLISSALDAGGKDNVTATLVAISESPYAISTFKEFNPSKEGSSTIIETRQPEIELKKSTKPLYLILGAVITVVIAVCLWIFVFRAAPGVTEEGLNKKDVKEQDSILVDSIKPKDIIDQSVIVDSDLNNEDGNTPPAVVTLPVEPSPPVVDPTEEEGKPEIPTVEEEKKSVE